MRTYLDDVDIGTVPRDANIRPRMVVEGAQLCADDLALERPAGAVETRRHALRPNVDGGAACASGSVTIIPVASGSVEAVANKGSRGQLHTRWLLQHAHNAAGHGAASMCAGVNG